MTHKVNHKFNIMPRGLFLSPAKAFLIFKIDIPLILYKIFKFVFSGQLHEISMKLLTLAKHKATNHKIPDLPFITENVTLIITT